jgi:hypothetical protein
VNIPTQLFMNVYQDTQLSKAVISKVGNLVGTQYIKIGNEEFDQRFIIKGQPEVDVVKVLSSFD